MNPTDTKVTLAELAARYTAQTGTAPSFAGTETAMWGGTANSPDRLTFDALSDGIEVTYVVGRPGRYSRLAISEHLSAGTAWACFSEWFAAVVVF